MPVNGVLELRGALKRIVIPGNRRNELSVRHNEAF